jgi:hypothetical protein
VTHRVGWDEGSFQLPNGRRGNSKERTFISTLHSIIWATVSHGHPRTDVQGNLFFQLTSSPTTFAGLEGRAGCSASS